MIASNAEEALQRLSDVFISLHPEKCKKREFFFHSQQKEPSQDWESWAIHHLNLSSIDVHILQSSGCCTISQLLEQAFHPNLQFQNIPIQESTKQKLLHFFHENGNENQNEQQCAISQSQQDNNKMTNRTTNIIANTRMNDNTNATMNHNHNGLYFGNNERYVDSIQGSNKKSRITNLDDDNDCEWNQCNSNTNTIANNKCNRLPIFIDHNSSQEESENTNPPNRSQNPIMITENLNQNYEYTNNDFDPHHNHMEGDKTQQIIPKTRNHPYDNCHDHVSSLDRRKSITAASSSFAYHFHQSSTTMYNNGTALTQMMNNTNLATPMQQGSRLPQQTSSKHHHFNSFQNMTPIVPPTASYYYSSQSLQNPNLSHNHFPQPHTTLTTPMVPQQRPWNHYENSYTSDNMLISPIYPQDTNQRSINNHNQNVEQILYPQQHQQNKHQDFQHPFWG